MIFVIFYTNRINSIGLVGQQVNEVEVIFMGCSITWNELRREYDLIQRASANSKAEKDQRGNQPVAKNFTAPKMQAIKDEVEAEETGNWTFQSNIEEKYKMSDYDCIFKKIREDNDQAIKNARLAVQNLGKTKKQSEINKAKDKLNLNQKQLFDLNKPVS